MIEDVGTLLFQSPEMFDSCDYDSKTDIWSLGCILFQLCNFDFPFNAYKEEKLIQNIQQGRHKQMDMRNSQEIRDLYEVCMNKD